MADGEWNDYASRLVRGETPSLGDYPLLATGERSKETARALEFCVAANKIVSKHPFILDAIKRAVKRAEEPSDSAEVLELAGIYRECRRLVARQRSDMRNPGRYPLSLEERASPQSALQSFTRDAEQLRERMTPEQVERALALAEQ